MNQRRRFLTVLGTSSLAVTFGCRGQTQSRLPRIGWLYASAIKAGTLLEQGFLQGLRETGFIEGRNVLIERRFADGHMELLPALAKELVDLKVDVIYAPTPPDAQAAQQATKTIPIVFALLGDPVRSGAAKSLARPGGNMTGVTTANTELVDKRYALLKEISPQAARMAVLYDPNVSENLQFLETSQAAAKQLGIVLVPVQAQRPEDFEPAFEAVKKSRPEALLVIANPLFYSHRRRITELVAGTRLPAMYGRIEFVDDGGLIAYSIDPVDQARRAAAYVARILKGAKPNDLPIERPSKLVLAVNLTTARALGLTLPQSILVRADRIIE